MSKLNKLLSILNILKVLIRAYGNCTIQLVLRQSKQMKKTEKTSWKNIKGSKLLDTIGN